MISRFKSCYGTDTLIPLEKNMDAYLDAKGLSKLDKAPWKKVDPHHLLLYSKKDKNI
jgi:hypothetical protein